MHRLVDNTYLQSVGACLRGEANSPKQVATFLRFVGEVICAEQMVFTGDKDGPVFPITERSYNDLSGIFDCDDWLHYVAISEMTFVEASYKAAEILVEDIKLFDPHTAVRQDDLLPGLHPEMSDPYLELHDYLSVPRHSEMAARYAEPKTSNFAGFVLSREPVRDALARRLNGKVLTPDGSALLATVVRMLAYDECARSMHATYLPSTARSELWTLPATPNSYILNLGMLPENETLLPNAKATDLQNVIEALITVSHGKPREILRQAWLLRTGTTKLRQMFSRLKSRGDAMVLHAEDLSAECQTVIAQLLGKKAKPRFFNALFRSVNLTFGLPGDVPTFTPNLNDDPLRDWVRYRQRRRHVHALAVLVSKGTKLDGGAAYARLLTLAIKNQT